MFFKTQADEDLYLIDFQDRLSSGETIDQSSVMVVIERATVDVWQVVPNMASAVTVIETGKTVQLTLGAGATEQLGRYRIRAMVTTSTGRDLEGIADLRVL